MDAKARSTGVTWTAVLSRERWNCILLWSNTKTNKKKRWVFCSLCWKLQYPKTEARCRRSALVFSSEVMRHIGSLLHLILRRACISETDCVEGTSVNIYSHERAELQHHGGRQSLQQWGLFECTEHLWCEDVLTVAFLSRRLMLAEKEWVASARNRPLSALNKNIETSMFPESTFCLLFLLCFKIRLYNAHWLIANSRLHIYHRPVLTLAR